MTKYQVILTHKNDEDGPLVLSHSSSSLVQAALHFASAANTGDFEEVVFHELGSSVFTVAKRGAKYTYIEMVTYCHSKDKQFVNFVSSTLEDEKRYISWIKDSLRRSEQTLNCFDKSSVIRYSVIDVETQKRVLHYSEEAELKKIRKK